MKKTSFIILLAIFFLQGFTQGTWTQKTDLGGAGRRKSVGFSIGTKGYIGTGTNPDFKDFWEYDPTLNSWTQKADFGGTARNYAVGFSIGGKGYIGTGFNGINIFNDFWEYDTTTNFWTQKNNFSGIARYAAVGFSIGTKGYIGCGTDSGMSTIMYNDFWEYEPSTDTWTQKANFNGGKRWGAVGFSIGSKGYIGTGQDSLFTLNDFWEYDPALDSWTSKANFAGGDKNDGVGFSIGSKGYIGAGKNDFWEYNPATDVWSQKANIGGNSTRKNAVGFSIGNKGYIGTGTDSTGGFLSDLWEYDPNGVGINENNISNEINIYPNPSTGIFTLQSSKKISQIEIVNILGEKIYAEKINSNKTIIDLSKQQKGIYFLKIQSEERIYTEKIIIQ